MSLFTDSILPQSFKTAFHSLCATVPSYYHIGPPYRMKWDTAKVKMELKRMELNGAEQNMSKQSAVVRNVIEQRRAE